MAQPPLLMYFPNRYKNCFLCTWIECTLIISNKQVVYTKWRWTAPSVVTRWVKRILLLYADSTASFPCLRFYELNEIPTAPSWAAWHDPSSADDLHIFVLECFKSDHCMYWRTVLPDCCQFIRSQRKCDHTPLVEINFGWWGKRV